MNIALISNFQISRARLQILHFCVQPIAQAGKFYDKISDPVFLIYFNRLFRLSLFFCLMLEGVVWRNFCFECDSLVSYVPK